MQDIQSIGFVQALMDFSFTLFVSESLVKILYYLGIVLFAIFGIVAVVVGFMNGISYGIGALIMAPVLFVVFVVALRVLLEFVIVVFRIADFADQIAKNSAKQDTDQ